LRIFAELPADVAGAQPIAAASDLPTTTARTEVGSAVKKGLRESMT